MTVSCKLYHEKLNSPASLASVTELVSQKQTPAILGGNISDTDANRFSVWAFEAKDIFVFNRGEVDPFGKLQQVLNKYQLDTKQADELPNEMYSCGWIGFFSYELGHYIEKIPQTAVDDLGLPLIRLCFYDRAICYDHAEKTWRLIALELAGNSESADDKLAELQELLKEAEGISVESSPGGVMEIAGSDIAKLNCNMTLDHYLDALKKTRKYIYDGDVYQVNFSQRFESDFAARAVDLYHWQNEHNPSPYAGFIGGDDFAIVSASPEMFITIRNGIISTKPIKGTRRRITGQPDAGRINDINFTELVQSQKEQAELNMIIDLERNDLARICEPGTRKVTQPRTIETYPTVFHAVATIEGRLKNPDSPAVFCGVLKATFPGGSITGAPKIRAMEIIDELEPTQRSVYTGSIGFLGVDGNVCLNIAIRTVIIKNSKAYTQTGGGIVADSDPQAEWDETITKARALLAGIEVVQKKHREQKKKANQYGKSIS